MCALSVAQQINKTLDLEWYMHYMIPSADLHRHFDDKMEVKPSLVPLSLQYPDKKPGCGLFTKSARKKGQLLIGFPGYWMEENVFGPKESHKDHYAFAIPESAEWGKAHSLLYVTHATQANFINAGVIGGEVQLFHLMTSLVLLCSHCVFHTFVGVGQAECALRVRQRQTPEEGG